MKYKIIDNPDQIRKELAIQALNDSKAKYGKYYCPCSLEQTQETICPCQEFRLQEKEGECNCGRYCKIMIT